MAAFVFVGACGVGAEGDVVVGDHEVRPHQPPARREDVKVPRPEGISEQPIGLVLVKLPSRQQPKRIGFGIVLLVVNHKLFPPRAAGVGKVVRAGIDNPSPLGRKLRLRHKHHRLPVCQSHPPSLRPLRLGALHHHNHSP